jgi:hypothetical protein
VIDERELYALGDHGTGPSTTHRPVEQVLARGAQLRRRRHAMRALGASTVVVGLIGSGLLVLGRSDERPDIEAAEDPTTTASDQPSAPPPPPSDCAADGLAPDEGLTDGNGVQFVAPENLAASEVPDELRVLPTFVPGDPPVTYAAGGRYTDLCPDAAPFPADAALELKADGGDGVAEATIRVDGPLPRPASDRTGLEGGPTELRGQPATFERLGESGTDGLFGWTESDGWSWSITGLNVDEATLRATAEALVLDSSPEGDEPAATLAPESVPTGFRITWQTPGTPTPVADTATQWDVSFGTTGPGEAGMRCELWVRERTSEVPLRDSGTVGTEPVSVNGQDALWNPVGGMGPLGLGSLTWMLSADVVASVGCIDQHDSGAESIGVETMIEVAQSVVPVSADDPRLPADPPAQR